MVGCGKCTGQTKCLICLLLEADEKSHPSEYRDTDHHEVCDDCKGSGYYTGFTVRKYCPTCDGSGYL